MTQKENGFTLCSCATPSVHERGFTLVELAIALMVIGLLIAGVLKGQELVSNARSTAMIRHITAVETAAQIFRNTYGYLPGDLKSPSTRLPDCTTAPCNVDGNQNGRIFGGTGVLQEVGNFFLHMGKTGLVNNVDMTQTGTYMLSPETPYEGHSAVVWMPSPNGSGNQGNYMEVSVTFDQFGDIGAGLPVQAAAQIDRKMDDGKPQTGDIQATEVLTTCLVGTEYNEGAPNNDCDLFRLMPM